MTDPIPSRRWYHPTPDPFVMGLLVVECLLWLSERFGWLPWPKGWAVLIAVASVAVALLVMLLWFITALLFRWRFQFSIRSLLVLTVAVALPFSWLAVEREQAKMQEKAVQEIQNTGGQAGYFYLISSSAGPTLPGGPPAPQWLQNLLGKSFLATACFAHVTDAHLEPLETLTQLQILEISGTQVTDIGLTHLKGLTKLQELSLDGTKVTDAGLAHLKGLTQLQRLYLRNTQVTDSGLAHLKGLTQLQRLYVCNTQVTDSGMEHLKGLSQLQALWLGGTKVTDAGLEHLKGLSQLRGLGLGDTLDCKIVTATGWEHFTARMAIHTSDTTTVTDEGVKKLQQALPNCQIKR